MAEVQGMAWEDFLADWRENFRPGEHVCLVGPTGRGKTTVLCQLVDHRDRVVLLDPKGGDTTLRRSGYQVIRSWPPPKAKSRRLRDSWHGRDGEPPKPIRVIYSPKVRTIEDWHASGESYRDVLGQIFADRGWTVGIDETRIAADMMDLKREISTLFVAARDKQTSVLAALQAPRWIPREALDQSSWVFAWPVRDRDTQGRVAEILGEDRESVRTVLESLSFHDVLVLDVVRDRMIVTSPRKLGGNS